MSASEAAGMVRLRSLSPGDEFTFAPRRGRFRVLRDPQGSRLIYEGLDLEAQKTTPKPTAAMSDWWVWPLAHEKTDDEHHAQRVGEAVERERLGHDYFDPED